MTAVAPSLPDDVEALKALLTAALQRADEAEARAANAVARESAIEAVIAHLKDQPRAVGRRPLHRQPRPSNTGSGMI